MVGLLVDLDFACCLCEGPVGVTVRCEGERLRDRRGFVAAGFVKCPHCEEYNRVCFEPDGTVRDVAHAPEAYAALELSVN